MISPPLTPEQTKHNKPSRQTNEPFTALNCFQRNYISLHQRCDHRSESKKNNSLVCELISALGCLANLMDISRSGIE
jgi:hypothetical protein